VSEKGVSVAYTPEFGTEAVRLYRVGGRGVRLTAHQIGVASGTLRKWVHQAQIDERFEDGLTSEERVKLRRLRREVRILEKRSCTTRSPGWPACSV
jgi:transposase